MAKSPKHRLGDPPVAPLEELLVKDALHVGRSWPRMPFASENGCPCPKAECGLAVPDPTIPCDQHNGQKTIRQAHLASQCSRKPKGLWKKP